jgi:hypothetical protein
VRGKHTSDITEDVLRCGVPTVALRIQVFWDMTQWELVYIRGGQLDEFREPHVRGLLISVRPTTIGQFLLGMSLLFFFFKAFKSAVHGQTLVHLTYMHIFLQATCGSRSSDLHEPFCGQPWYICVSVPIKCSQSTRRNITENLNLDP